MDLAGQLVRLSREEQDLLGLYRSLSEKYRPHLWLFLHAALTRSHAEKPSNVVAFPLPRR